MKNDLTEGSVIKKLLLFVAPIFGANLLQAMYGTVDLIVVGYFSDAAAVSAVATGSMAMHTVNGVIFGLTTGCMILLGQNIGNRDFVHATKTIASSFLLFFLLGLFMTGLIPGIASLLADLMNAPAEAFSQTVSYIKVCGFGILFIIFFNVIGGLFRGIGDSKSPFILMFIACVCNIICDVILVGFFHMGSTGAALATVFAQFVSVISAAFLVKRRGFGFAFQKSAFRPADEEIRKILKYGVPVAAQEALTGLSFAVITAVLNSFGLIASAGVGIAEKIVGLIFLVPGAMSAAVSAFTAQNIGAGLKARARQSMFIGIGSTFAVGLIMFYLSFFHGEWLAGFFTSDRAVMAACADFLKSYAIDCVLVSFNFSMMGYLNGCGRTLFVSVQGILSTFLVRIPFSYFVSKVPGATLFQVGFATPLATSFAMVLLIIYLIRFEKKAR